MQQDADKQLLADGWCAPPHWYRFFPEGEYDPLEFPRPAIPAEETINAFGTAINLGDDDVTATIDADDKLYSDESGCVKAEFARLFETMVEEVVVLFGQNAQVNSANAQGASGRSKNIIRLYKNLQHILHRLRVSQFDLQMQAKLQNQIDYKLGLINDIRQLAFSLEPLTLQDVANHTNPPPA